MSHDILYTNQNSEYLFREQQWKAEEQRNDLSFK